MKTKTASPPTASLNDLEVKLNEIFGEKAPQLPENIKVVLVKYGPYITLILLIMGLPAILGVLGLSALFTPFAFLGGVMAGVGLGAGTLVSVATLVLTVMALPGLFKRQLSAWRLMFWSSLVNALGALIRLDLGGLVIGSVISWYILFQVRSYYK